MSEFAAAAVSKHPVSAHAIGEAAGQILEELGVEPDLALVFVTPGHAGALEDVAGAIRAVLRPATLIGCSAVSVVGTGIEVEDEPGIALWAARVGPVAPIRVTDEVRLPNLPFEPSALLLLGDPYSCRVEDVFEGVEKAYPALPTVGGMASAARGPGGNRLVLDDTIFTTGAVGAFLSPFVEVEAVVSQGCRPIGTPLAVTRVQGQIVQELAGRPPLERLVELAQTELSEAEVGLINSGGLQMGVAIDEHNVEFQRGDFLVRSVLGGDRETGWVALGDEVDVGTTLQFHLRDANTADDDLRSLLRDKQADAALLFTCNGRGRSLFGKPDHDAVLVDDMLRRPPTAGFFAAGEFGPVGSRNFVHGFTASIALLRSRRSTPRG